MYERFTDRARKVMQLAHQEALRFNHEYIGTEHILLGLVKENSGVAAHVLKSFHIDPRKIRLEVEKLIQSGPDMVVTIGGLPQTPRAKRVIEYSMEEARNLNYQYIGTEHILLGLLREGEGVGGQVLMNLGLTLKIVRDMTLAALEQGIGDRKSGSAAASAIPAYPKSTSDEIDHLQKQKETAIADLDFEKAAGFRDRIEEIKRNADADLRTKADETTRAIKSRMRREQISEMAGGKFQPRPGGWYSRFTDRAKKVMQLANQEAQRFKHEYIGTEHILLGLIEEGSGVAAAALRALDIDPGKVRREVEALITNAAGTEYLFSGVPQTPRAKKTIEYSIEEARSLNHEYVGTEHILLGLLREQHGPAAQVLVNLGLKLDIVRETVLEVLGKGFPLAERGIPDSFKLVESLFPNGVTAEIERLRKDKEEAVARGDFERAAELRDQVDAIVKIARAALRAKLDRPDPQVLLPSHGLQDFDQLYRGFNMRARTIMQRAKQEAVRRNNEYVGTEHITLALIKLGSGGAAKVLKNTGIDRQTVRFEIEKVTQSGSNMIPPGTLPLTPRARHVVAFAADEAGKMGRKSVGPEHILLGLLREVECAPHQVFLNLGLTLDKARQEVLKLPNE